jgi:hypothetical protein
MVRNKFTQKQIENSFYSIYKINNPRCILCKYNYIYLVHDYPILKTDGEVRKSFDSDHMIPLANGGADDLSNLVQICKMCNNVKGPIDYIKYLIRFYATTRKNNYNPSVLLSLSEAIDYCKENKNNIYYSDFIIYELTQNAKMIQLKMIYEFFINNVGFEPINDIIFDYNSNQYYLSPESNNFEYLYNYWHSKPQWYEFLIIHTLLRKNKNLENPFYNKNDLIAYLKNHKFDNIYFSDFIFYDMTLNDKIEHIIYIKQFFDKYIGKEPIFDIVYDDKLNDIVLASNSTNINYYYRGKLDGTQEWTPSSNIAFLFMIVSMRKLSIFDPTYDPETLYSNVQKCKLLYSDFINETMSYQKKLEILNNIDNFTKNTNIIIHDDIKHENNNIWINDNSNRFYYNYASTTSYLGNIMNKYNFNDFF